MWIPAADQPAGFALTEEPQTPSPAAPGQLTEVATEPLTPAVDPHSTNLHFFHGMAQWKLLPEGEFTKVKKLRGCKTGNNVQLCRRNRPEFKTTPVIMKNTLKESVEHSKTCESNDKKLFFQPELPRAFKDALTEAGVYSFLSQQAECHPSFLKMLGCFADSTYVSLALEYAEGGAAIDMVYQHGPLKEDKLKVHASQLIEGVKYLHSLRIGHRHISLESILVKKGSFCLIDFGHAAPTHSPCGQSLLRFLNLAGTHPYRPPEAYCPKEEFIRVIPPPYAVAGDVVFARYLGGFCHARVCPEDGEVVVTGQECRAQNWGYTLPAADAFACGVCLYFLAVGVADIPLRLARSGIHDVLQGNRQAVPDQAFALLEKLVATDPEMRPSMEQCLSSPWLAELPPLEGGVASS